MNPAMIAKLLPLLQSMGGGSGGGSGSAVGGGGGGSVGGAAAGGALSGAASGASMGMAAGPYGAIAGAIIGGVAGGISKGHKAKKRKDAEGMMPPAEDPEVRSYLNDVGRQKRSFRTGTAFQESLRELNDSQAIANEGMIKAGGGASGATISGLAKTQRTTGTIYNQILSKGMEEDNVLEQLYSGILGNISQRKLELGLLKYSQVMTETTDAQRKGNANSSAGGAMGGGGGMGDILSMMNTGTGTSGASGEMNKNIAANDKFKFKT